MAANKVVFGNKVFIYRKARNSVLLDSTGDVIEDGFEQ